MRVIINDRICEAEYGEFILAVARRNGIDIPAICHSDALTGMGSCRLCLVELVEGEKTRIVASCIYPITRELEIRTDSYRILRMRKIIIKLLLSRAPENEYLNGIARKYGLQPSKLLNPPEKADNCILCGLCVKACEEMGVSAISTTGRGTTKKVSTPYDEPSAVCIGCGSCAEVCPTGAIEIKDRDGTRTIWGRTFELLSCERCGQYYASREYIEFMESKLGKKLEGNYCSHCRRALCAEKFKDITKT